MGGQPTDSLIAAASTTEVTASGWETITACDDAMRVTVAPARSAIQCWPAGGIALSSSVTRAQHGRDFQAGSAAAVPPNALSDRGPLLLAHQPAPAPGRRRLRRPWRSRSRGM